jgi:hypothetical protein
MDWVWIAAIAVAIVVAFRIASRAKKQPRRIILFAQADGLFTAAERSFLGVLDQATAGRYRVFGKVRIADVLTTVKGLDNRTRTSVLNRIRSKHFDFVLCDPATMKVKAVIELNDKSHASSRRIERDELVSTACADAGLALRMVKAQRSYSLETVRQLVEEIEIEVRAELQDRKATPPMGFIA